MIFSALLFFSFLLNVCSRYTSVSNVGVEGSWRITIPKNVAAFGNYPIIFESLPVPPYGSIPLSTFMQVHIIFGSLLRHCMKGMLKAIMKGLIFWFQANDPSFSIFPGRIREKKRLSNALKGNRKETLVWNGSVSRLLRFFAVFRASTQLAITCSKLTIETLEQGGVVLVSLLLTLNIGVVLVSLLLILNIFYTLF